MNQRIVGPSVVSVELTGLMPGTRCYISVVAINAAGESPQAHCVERHSIHDRGLSGDELQCRRNAGHPDLEPRRQWEQPDHWLQAVPLRQSGSNNTPIASPSALSYTDTGLANGHTYMYKVSAVNALERDTTAALHRCRS